MKEGCSVFVGNIDFEIDEPTVIKELSAAGRVVSFRLMIDKNTGKSKGYGFCEYESPAIAESAMRNLKFSFNGRPVKINYAENDLPTKIKEPESKPLQIENIVNALDSMDEGSIKEVLGYIKQMAVDQPTELNEIFEQNPKLVCAIMHVLVKANVIDKAKVLQLLNSSFDAEKQIDQISDRISHMGEDSLKPYSEEIRQRLTKLRYVLTKKDHRT